MIILTAGVGVEAAGLRVLPHLTRRKVPTRMMISSLRAPVMIVSRRGHSATVRKRRKSLLPVVIAKRRSLIAKRRSLRTRGQSDRRKNLLLVRIRLSATARRRTRRRTRRSLPKLLLHPQRRARRSSLRGPQSLSPRRKFHPRRGSGERQRMNRPGL